MNITYQDRIDLTLDRAEKRLLENKTAIKTYVRKKTAQKVANELSKNLANYWEVRSAPVDILQLSNGRFFCAVDLNNIMFNSKIGGYLFTFLDGHWTISTEINVLNKLESYQEIDFLQTKSGQWCENSIKLFPQNIESLKQ